MIYYIAHWDWILKNSRSDISNVLKNNFDITAITPVENKEYKLQNSYFEVIDLDYNRKKLLDFKGILHLRRICKNFSETDLIHIFTLKTLIIYLLGSLFSKKNAKVIVSITGLGYLFAGTNFANLLKIFLRPLLFFKLNKYIDVLIFQNQENKNQFIKYTKFSKKVEIVEGSGLNTNVISKKEYFNDVYKVIFVSRILKEKGIYEFLEIVNKMSENKKFEFFIAGSVDDGNKSSITENEMRNIVSNNNIDYLGEINVKSELKNYDILLSPSYHEGFSRIILEAAYTGLFCLANDISGIKSIVEKLKCGRLVNNNNIEDYVNELENIEESIKTLNKTNIRNLINLNYSIEAISQKMRNIYSEFI